MRRLIEALNGEARLNDAGRAYFAERIGNVLLSRLRAEDWFRRHPEILEEEIRAPLAIVGLPRTGTTMMHRTIASDHRMYAPLWYEVRNPAPLPGTDFAAGTDPRIAVAEAEVRALLETSPDLASIHPMDARGPDEDIMSWSSPSSARCRSPSRTCRSSARGWSDRTSARVTAT